MPSTNIYAYFSKIKTGFSQLIASALFIARHIFGILINNRGFKLIYFSDTLTVGGPKA